MTEYDAFHQSEALTTRLSNILEEYPPGVSTLREFVQNADDAGASRLVICLDLSSHGDGEQLPTEKLREYASQPALLVWNDATFSERDFQSISSVGKSRKREDGTTIGKYGLGFNVAYHFTDCVQFVSGRSFVCFDPHGTALPNGELGLRAAFADGYGARWPGLLRPLLAPLRRFDEAAAAADEQLSQPVASTLFRLPLRTAAQARKACAHTSHALHIRPMPCAYVPCLARLCRRRPPPRPEAASPVGLASAAVGRPPPRSYRRARWRRRTCARCSTAWARASARPRPRSPPRPPPRSPPDLRLDLRLISA